MSNTRLCVLVRQFEERIERNNSSGTGCRQRAQALRNDLLCLLETGTVADSLERFARKNHGMPTALQRLRDELADDRLPKLAYSLRVGATERDALRQSGATRSELKMLRNLARSVEKEPGEYSVRVPHFPPWMAQLQAKAEKVVVVLDQRAVQDMLLTALEGYRVSAGPGRPYTEIYGICFGHIREENNARRASKPRVTRYVTVIACPAQIRARATPSSVWPNDRSLKTQIETCRALFPNIEVVGDFHSHPYPTLRDMVRIRGWEYSRGDQESNPRWVHLLRTEHYNPQVGFIVAVASKDRAERQGYFDRYGENTHQVSVGHCQCVIAAYRILGDGTYAKKGVELYCGAMNMAS